MMKDPEDDLDGTLVRLVEAYQDMLLRMCYVWLRDEEQARDAVQETFIKAYKGLPSFRGACSERTWLVRIAVNTCRSMRRSAWFRHIDRHVTPEQLPLLQSEPPREEDSELLLAIMRLSPRLREVLLLYYWKDMDMNEIAEAMVVAQSTVSVRLKRARDKLRGMLEGGEGRG